jgi:DDE superfamily endonuclease
MKHPDLPPGFCAAPLPTPFLYRLAVFADEFTRPTWTNALLLLTGAVLSPGRRVVTAALRILGLDEGSDFPTYHAVLSQARWSSRVIAGLLLRMLVATFVTEGSPVVIGLDDTIERRWGKMIKARGIYRDAARSSKGFFVKTSGLRWLSAMLLTDIPWAGRLLALPFLTVLAPSERFYKDKPCAHKTLLDWARQMVLQIHRWLPDRKIIIVGDSAFAAIDFLGAVRSKVCVVTRLRLDAALYDSPPPRRKARGRPAGKGKRLPGLTDTLKDKATKWQRHTVNLWYGRTNRTIEVATGTAIWYRSGLPPVPIRWILVREPTSPEIKSGKIREQKDSLMPQAFLCTDLQAEPNDILRWFISRWQVEVTFAEARAHLGVETQRQWSDLAILRTTPALFGLFSLIVLWMHDLSQYRDITPRAAPWYGKTALTFSDAIAAVRREIWNHQIFCMSRSRADTVQIPRHAWERIANAVSFAR